ncbi:MAG: patatin-like phospholipase family protein [Myxococcota bacterium]
MAGPVGLEERREGVRRAVVLSGGGARGAYETGVLQFILAELPHRLGFVPRFDIYSGTSVGAVHACHLAAHSDDPAAGVRRLGQVWRDMSFSSVYRFGLSDAFGFTRTLVGFATGTSVGAETEADRIHGMFNTERLEKLVVNEIPWRRLRRNLRQGCFDALCVSATEIASGRTLVFVDNRERRVETWTRDSQLVARPARIGPDHALASAAIPVLFPAVRVKGSYFCDGSLRQQTPLAPALRLGSNRVLSIGLRHPRLREASDPLAEERVEHFRSAGFLFGKVLNALLIDRLEYDLGHMRVLNQVLRAAVETAGQDHLDMLNTHVARERGLGFQIVEDCCVRPSEDIGVVAARHVRRLRKKRSRSWIGSVALRALARGAPVDEADLVSYLLFDGEYAADLIDLGRSDAQACEDELIRFFSS